MAAAASSSTAAAASGHDEPAADRQAAEARKLRARVERYRTQAFHYANPQKLAMCEALLPVEVLELARAGPAEAVVRTMLRWFRGEFFSWTNQPLCGICGHKASQNEGMTEPSEEDLAFGATRVEAWRCLQCDSVARFPRYSDPVRLLDTRHGRCGEWANCFTLLLAALGLQARLVVDWTDHVWTEIRLNDDWTHCDPCEEVLDAPLMYEVGWAKKLSYIVAFSPLEVVDVTARYTARWSEILQQRLVVPEEQFDQLIAEMDLRTREEAVGGAGAFGELPPPPRWREQELASLQARQWACATGAAAARAPTAAELRGRMSGSVTWRQERGELGPPSPGHALGVDEADGSLTLVAQYPPDLSDSGARRFACCIGGAFQSARAGSLCVDLTGEMAALEMVESEDVDRVDAFLHPDGFTVEAWVWLDNSSALKAEHHRNPLVSRHGPGCGWELRLTREGGAVFLVTVDGTHHEVEGAPVADAPAVGLGSITGWRHIAGSFDGCTARVFVSGVSVAEAAVPSGCRNVFDGPLCIAVNPAWRDRCTPCCLHSMRIARGTFTPDFFMAEPAIGRTSCFCDDEDRDEILTELGMDLTVTMSSMAGSLAHEEEEAALFYLASMNVNTAPSIMVPWSQLLPMSLTQTRQPLTLTVGRSTSCNVQLEDPRVSSQHFEVKAMRRSETGNPSADGHFVYDCLLTDLSSNGTFVNGVPIGKGETRLLRSGDEVAVLPAEAVGELNRVAFVFRNATEVISHKPSEPPVPEVNLEELVRCPICIFPIHKCVASVPCLHNYCSACCSSWLRHRKECPICNQRVDVVVRNHAMDKVVEALFAAQPDLRRDPDELRDMDRKDMLQLGGNQLVFRVSSSRPKDKESLERTARPGDPALLATNGGRRGERDPARRNGGGNFGLAPISDDARGEMAAAAATQRNPDLNSTLNEPHRQTCAVQ